MKIQDLIEKYTEMKLEHEMNLKQAYIEKNQMEYVFHMWAIDYCNALINDLKGIS